MKEQLFVPFPEGKGSVLEKKYDKNKEIKPFVKELKEEKTALDIRRKRLVFRAWHRGMREVDLILGRFAAQRVATMRGDELDVFERILSYEDRDLLDWLSGQVPVPPEYDSVLLRDIMNNSIKS